MAAALFVTTLASAQSSAPAVEEALEKGRRQLQQHEYFEALKTYQRANALAGGRSAEASLGMAQATYGMKVFKNSLDQCQATIDLKGLAISSKPVPDLRSGHAVMVFTKGLQQLIGNGISKTLTKDVLRRGLAILPQRQGCREML